MIVQPHFKIKLQRAKKNKYFIALPYSKIKGHNLSLTNTRAQETSFKIQGKAPIQNFKVATSFKTSRAQPSINALY